MKIDCKCLIYAVGWLVPAIVYGREPVAMMVALLISNMWVMAYFYFRNKETL